MAIPVQRQFASLSLAQAAQRTKGKRPLISFWRDVRLPVSELTRANPRSGRGNAMLPPQAHVEILCPLVCVSSLLSWADRGPSFISGLRQRASASLRSVLVSALLPYPLGILFPRYVLAMEPLIVLGAYA